MSCQRVEHQYDSDPPLRFLPASISTAVVHYLSGLTTPTSRFLPDPTVLVFSSPVWKSPWSVFQYGSEYLGLCFCIFTFHFLKEGFSMFDRSTIRYRSLFIFSFRSLYLLSLHCTTKQHYSESSWSHPGLSPAMALLSRRFCRPALQHNDRGLAI